MNSLQMVLEVLSQMANRLDLLEILGTVKLRNTNVRIPNAAVPNRARASAGKIT
jgi:hypothetical protein